MRQGVIVETQEGTRRLLPAEIVQLPFPLIAAILDSEGSVLYFKQATDKALFLAVYPEKASLL